MSMPPPSDGSDEPSVDLHKTGADATEKSEDAAFDPYRFGRPEHPVPPEFAPPGYIADPPAADPYAAPPNPYGSQHSAQPYHPTGQPSGPPPYQPYGQPGANYPAYPSYPQSGYPGAGYPPVDQGNNGKAITSMVLGIVSIPLFFLTWLDLALIVPALVFGILGLQQAKQRAGKGRSQAITGLVCLVVGAIAATIFTVFIVHRANDCQHYREDGDDIGYSQCIRDGN